LIDSLTRTHGGSDGRHWKVVVIAYVADEQEIHVTAVWWQQQHWILTDQLPQLIHIHITSSDGQKLLMHTAMTAQHQTNAFNY